MYISSQTYLFLNPRTESIKLYMHMIPEIITTAMMSIPHHLLAYGTSLIKKIKRTPEIRDIKRSEMAAACGRLKYLCISFVGFMSTTPSENETQVTRLFLNR